MVQCFSPQEGYHLIASGVSDTYDVPTIKIWVAVRDTETHLDFTLILTFLG